jgi:hypothetical protein
MDLMKDVGKVREYYKGIKLGDVALTRLLNDSNSFVAGENLHFRFVEDGRFMFNVHDQEWDEDVLSYANGSFENSISEELNDVAKDYRLKLGRSHHGFYMQIPGRTSVDIGLCCNSGYGESLKLKLPEEILRVHPKYFCFGESGVRSISNIVSNEDMDVFLGKVVDVAYRKR